MIPFFIAASLTVEFIGPCSERPLLSTTLEARESSNLGQVTIETLEKYKIQYQGSEAGLHSAFGSPIGVDAIEVVSNNEMRSSTSEIKEFAKIIDKVLLENKP